MNFNLCTNSERRNEVMTTKKSFFSNSLCETNLCGENPSLKSKTKGEL